MTRLVGCILLLQAFWLLSSCSINPATGTPDVVFMSESREISLGTELHNKLLETTPVYPDEKLQTYVNSIGQKLVNSSHRSELNYTFTIIDSPDINAFALPGGYIYINRGLIGYLQSEAQLAAVLAHEIGHVTARHSVKQDAARKGSGAVTILSVLTTGSSVVGDVTNMWGTAAVMGYGREMELQADGLGAEYLYNAGYNPKAMIEVITVLKDHERFSRRLALDSGKKPTSYHGVFASHPRNDLRLQEVIAKAGELPATAKGSDNRDEFRTQTEGLLYGINYQAKTLNEADKNTYSHGKLGFSIDFPPGWSIDNQRTQIVAQANDKHARITITIDALEQPTAPNSYIQTQLNVPALSQSEPLSQFGLIGHTGVVPTSENSPYPERLAVIYRGSLVFIIRGETLSAITPAAEQSKNQASSEKKEESQKTADDPLFVEAIRSFRPSSNLSSTASKSQSIHYVKANQNTTFARLAEVIDLGKYGEQQLRLLNGYYPSGEPEPGEWIKIIR